MARKLSVGYGDWPLEEQREIFGILDPKTNIGVELNDACLMIPEKERVGADRDEAEVSGRRRGRAAGPR